MGALTGGTVCIRLCNPTSASGHAATLHAHPALWPGLILGVLTLLWWVNEKLREREQGMDVVVEFEPWDEDDE